jgi:chemotaxis methyl-accepting protein methylase
LDQEYSRIFPAQQAQVVATYQAGVSCDLSERARLKMFGKFPAGFYLRLNRRIWKFLLACGISILSGHTDNLVRLLATREQYFGTFFLRNRPALELMRRLVEQEPDRSTLRIAVLACSAGAEIYSILCTIRSARPDLKVLVRAVDISKEILNFAEKGVYASDTRGLVGSSIFERLTAYEMEHMFDSEGDEARVKPWLREGTTWQLGDASSPELILFLGPQDIVVANNFLCHMEPPAAENCLRNNRGLGGS